LLHHDSITGTSRKGTIEDYFKRIEQAQVEIDKALAVASVSILGNGKVKLKAMNQIKLFNQAVYSRS